jgi:hypothetical protein
MQIEYEDRLRAEAEAQYEAELYYRELEENR